MKKLLIAVSAVIAIIMFASCSGGNGGTVVSVSTETVKTAASETEVKSRHESADFGGKIFNVLTWGKSGDLYTNNGDIYAENETGDIINDAVYKRNLTVGEKYNITVKAISGGTADQVKGSVMAGDRAYDCVMLGMSNAFSLARGGYLLECGRLGNIDLEDKWWNGDAARELSINNKCYFMLCDINMQQWTQNALVFFNKLIAQNYGIGNLYGLVKDGGWTFEKFSALSAGVYEDLNGDGGYDENDRYGSTMSNYGVPSLIYGCGFNFVKKDAEGGLKIQADQNFYTLFDKIVAYCHAPTTLYTDLDMYKSRRAEITWTSFTEGRVLFLVEKFDIYNKLRDMDEDFGLLPMPKADEAQEQYYTWTHNLNGASTAVPSDCADPDMTSMVLDDMAFYSMKYVRPAYYDMSLSRKMSRDNESQEMLDLIVNGVLYDISYVATSLQNEFRTLADGNKGVLASTMSALENQYTTQLDEAVADYSKLQ